MRRGSMTDPVTLAYIGLAGIALNGVLTIAQTVITNMHAQKLAELTKAVKGTADTIQVLEKNTNSIKDELVRVTGQAEFARGMKQGFPALPGQLLAFDW
jgi:hypothetical protein